MRILLAEDEELIGRMVELNLRHDGHEVVWERTGTGAEQRALAEPWDLLVLDVMLPGVTGFQIARAVRETGALDYARAQAVEEAHIARACAQTLPPSMFRDALLSLTSLAVDRDR